MDRSTFYYRQKVLEEDLNDPFDSVEQALWNYAIDTDTAPRTPTEEKENFGGIVRGLVPFNYGWPQVAISAGAAFDELGRRIATDTELVLNIFKNGRTATGLGGTPDGDDITPADGYERWLTIYLCYEKSDTDRRFDGYNEPIFKTNTESFYFEIIEGPEAANPTLVMDPNTSGPDRQLYKVLICDVHIRNVGGTTTIKGIHKVTNDGEIEGNYGEGNRRTEFFFNYFGELHSVKYKQTARDALYTLAQYFDAHLQGDSGYRHAATAVEFSPGDDPVWADGVGGAYGGSPTVDAALKGIVNDLNSIVAAGGVTAPGAAKIGIKASTGSILLSTAAAPFDLPETNIQGVLEAIRAELNGRIFRGGDTEIAGDLAPTATLAHKTLGLSSQRWDGYLEDLNVSGDLTVEATGTVDFDATVLFRKLATFQASLTSAIDDLSLSAITATNTHATGRALNASAPNGGDGIYGGTTSGYGVIADATTGTALWAGATSGKAIIAENTSESENTLTVTNHSTGTVTAAAIKGVNALSTAILGVSTDAEGIRGESTTSFGVYGTSPEIAIFGYSYAADGVGISGYADDTDGIGVMGGSLAYVGIKGMSEADSTAAIWGLSEAAAAGIGVLGSTQSPGGYGVLGDIIDGGINGVGIEGRGSAANSCGVIGRATAATAIGVQGSNFEHLAKQRIVMAVPMSQGIPNALHWEYDPSLGLWYNTGSIAPAEISFIINDVPSNAKVISIAIAYINTDSNSIEFGVTRRTTSFTAMSPALAGGSGTAAALFSTTQLLPKAGGPAAAWIYLKPDQNQSISRFYQDGTPLYYAQSLTFWFSGSATATASEHKIYGIWYVVEFYSVSPYYSSYQARVTP